MKLIPRNVTLPETLDELVQSHVAVGRYANTSEAIRDALWQAFGPGNPRHGAEHLRRLLDEALDDTAPAMTVAEVKAHFAKKRGV
jgi:putative addiction module CopG family antidote